MGEQNNSSKQETTFTFHFGKGDLMTLWAETQKEAIHRFQSIAPGVTFMTHTEFLARKRRAEVIILGEATVVADTPVEAAGDPSLALVGAS